MTPNGWVKTTVGDVCVGLYDGPHATPRKTSEGPVFLGISCLNNGRLDLSVIEHLSEPDFTKWTRRVAVLPLDQRVRDFACRYGSVARPSLARGLSRPNSKSKAA